jgi:hypothetical protein
MSGALTLSTNAGFNCGSEHEEQGPAGFAASPAAPRTVGGEFRFKFQVSFRRALQVVGPTYESSGDSRQIGQRPSPTGRCQSRVGKLPAISP